VIRNEIRPFARKILPVVNRLAPATKGAGETFPNLAVSFSVLNEFFNELAYNPGPSRGGFLFFLDWGNHNLNSILSTSDAHGVLGRTLVYFNCEVLPILSAIGTVNPTVNLIIGLLKPPTAAECQSQGLTTKAGIASAKAGAARAPKSALDTRARAAALKLFKGLEPQMSAKEARAANRALASAMGSGG
jgi:hypothetical protein